MRNILSRLNFYNSKFISFLRSFRFIHHVIVVSIFLAVCVFGIFYYDFYQVAQSESGIFFYPSYNFQENLNSWGSYYFGSRSSQSLAYTTFIFRFFIYPDFPYPFIVQFSYYLILILLGWFGFYKCLGIFYQNKNSVFKLYCALVYIFNPASLSIIYRFQYPYITFYFLLPLIVYLIYSALHSNDKNDFLKLTLILNIVLSIFSIIYASMPTLIILFLIFVIVTSLMFIKNLCLKFTFFRVIPFYVIWLCLNMYWLFPLFLEFTTPNKLYNSLQVLDTGSNFGNLEFFSKRDSTLINIFTLFSSEYITVFSYGNLLIQLVLHFVSFTPIVLFLFLFYFSLKNKKSYFITNFFLLSIFLAVAFFLVRGLNFPFSMLYELLFKELPPFQIFRNPFEKGIMIFALPYLILFSISLMVIYEKLRKKNLALIILVFYVSPFSLFFLSSQLLIGQVPPFINKSQGFRIEFPYYYREIKSKMKESGLVKPIIVPIVSEGITYNWEKGYIGQDILHSYLSPYGYSFNSPDRFFDRRTILNNIYYATDKGGLLKMYGFDSIVTRKDYDFISRSELDPNSLSKYFLENYSFDFKNTYILENLLISSSTRKINSVLDGSETYGSENFLVKSDWEKNLFVKISLNDMSTIPSGSPFIIVVDSSDISKINELNIKFNLDESYKFYMKKNNSFCESCYSSEIINIPIQKNINSFTLDILTNNRSQDFIISRIYKVPVTNKGYTSNGNDFIYNNEYQSELSSLYSVEKGNNIFSTVNLVSYNNFNFFLSNKIDSERYTYVQDDKFQEVENITKSLNMKEVNVSYKKISESEYQVFLKPKSDESNVSTILTLKNSADSFWKVLEEGSPVFGITNFESDKYHFMSNTFSNSFIVQNIPNEGKVVRVIYLPQYYYNILSKFSLIVFFLLTITAIAKTKTKKLKNDK